MSFAAPHLFGDNLEAFERDVSAVLTALSRGVIAALKSLLFDGEAFQKGSGVLWPWELSDLMPDLFGVATVRRVGEYRPHGAADRSRRLLVLFDHFGNAERRAAFGV